MHHRTEKITLLIVDFLTINSAWMAYFFFRVNTGWFDLIIMPDFILPMLVVYFYWLSNFIFVGMYRTWFALSRLDEILSLLKCTFIGIFILFFVIYLDDYTHGVTSETRILIFIYWGFLVVFVASGRLILRSVQRSLLIKGFGRKNAVIIGEGEKAFEIAREVENHRGLGLDIVGYITESNSAEQDSGKPYTHLGSVHNLAEILDKNSVKEIIIALEKHNNDLIIEILGRIENRNIGIKIVPDLYELLSGQAKTTQLYGLPLIDINPELMPEWEKKAKRILDIFISILILIISAPVIFATAIAIKLDSKGPIFYTQERCGLNGKPFRIVKFRSMHAEAEKATGPVWSQKDDPRITRVGKFIRKVRIDELPQMINVLKGEMSLVGPRPERPFFVEKLAEEIPYYKRRLRVRPGITGWAQVKHKYDESIEDVKMKLRYDLFYIENMSLRMDLKILVRTIFVVFFGKGHYE